MRLLHQDPGILQYCIKTSWFTQRLSLNLRGQECRAKVIASLYELYEISMKSFPIVFLTHIFFLPFFFSYCICSSFPPILFLLLSSFPYDVVENYLKLAKFLSLLSECLVFRNFGLFLERHLSLESVSVLIVWKLYLQNFYVT